MSSEDESTTPPKGFVYRFVAVIERFGRFFARDPSPRVRRVLLVLAVTVFVVAAVLALRRIPEITQTIRWPILALGGLAGTSLVLISNSTEYYLMGRLLDQRISARESVRVSILSSAANLLPLPGGVLVRTQALVSRGSGYSRALRAGVVFGAGWVGTSGVVAGVIQLVQEWGPFGLALVGGGTPLLAISFLTLRTLVSRDRVARLFFGVLGVELLAVLAMGVRLFAALEGLGFSASFSDGITLGVATALSAAVTILPAGLGLRELLAAGLSPFLGLLPAEGLLATAVDRLAGLAFNGIAALGLLVWRGSADRAPDVSRTAR